MDSSAFDAAWQALVIIADPWRMLMLSMGVVLGLILGILPGIGGLAGTALLLPLTFGMDPYAAFALLLGLGATTATGDPIPAILFGIPGSSGSAATVLDGLPMAKRGEAGRALSAAYMSSMMGGVFGAFMLALAIPIMRPLMLYVGSPELLAFSVLGLSMVASLSGSAPLRGVGIACLGLLISMVGADPHTGTFRWTFDTLYLWEGVPIIAVVLGLFALPEMADLAIGRTSITQGGKMASTTLAGMIQGAKDSWKNWWLVVRCSWMGAYLGALPGISGSIVDWMAYGHALRTVKGAGQTFGKGDVRGVIASESANNAREGGALIPTIAFGVPGSATMAILLGAFMIHGLLPGPDMLTKNLPITYSMVWSIAIANILGAGLCYLFSGQFARLAILRYTLILPSIMSIVFIGAYQGSHDWGDFYALILFGILGWTMKQLRWPRAPLILGVVLGEIVERYLFISIERYGASWMLHPLVLVLLGISALVLVSPLIKDIRMLGGVRQIIVSRQPPRVRKPLLFTATIFGLVGVMLAMAMPWEFNARIVPMIVAITGLIFIGLSLFNELMPLKKRILSEEEEEKAKVGAKLHMDLESDTGHLPQRTVLLRAGIFFGWIVAMLVTSSLVGLMLSMPLFIIAYMRLEAREPWRVVLPYAVITTAFVYVVFEHFLTIYWPASLLGSLYPDLRSVYHFI